MDGDPPYPECPHCGEDVLPWDDQVVINGGAQPIHRECLLRSVVGSVGHQLGRCPCHGGHEGDPPGMTRREAARAALDLFGRTKGGT
jgi:hypothetical protein